MPGLQVDRLRELKGEARPVRKVPRAAGDGNAALRLMPVEPVGAGGMNRNASPVYRDCLQIYRQCARGGPSSQRGLDDAGNRRPRAQQDLSFDDDVLFELGFEGRTRSLVT